MHIQGVQLTTCDQIYLLLRAVIVKTLSGTHYRLYYKRVLVRSSSKAAEQCSSGNYCHDNDNREDQRHLVTNVRTLEMQASKLEEQVQDLTEKYKKALADCDTVRKKTQKFVEDAKLFGIQSFCRDLVEVADLLEQTAVEFEGEERVSLRLNEIQSSLQGVFTKHGLEKMTPVGGQYDPYDHEIVCHVPAEGVQPGIVAVVRLDGYKLHGRTIRHALVGTALHTQEQ
ncbi:grpE protein homolog 2, mitochondrial-like isoform X1 [Brienomyrus brachyistius]|uniref:grpE protein homolog 2, mitochondrial-like isoform X1 n=2 Tax=Brienomyrus brachyistius TaxID=42636 RepID=UPI0020B318E5|nr:grpE protein homolog 2, mitochondrial-like isoform X1 [Brienomyrus brachyistius]